MAQIFSETNLKGGDSEEWIVAIEQTENIDLYQWLIKSYLLSEDSGELNALQNLVQSSAVIETSSLDILVGVRDFLKEPDIQGLANYLNEVIEGHSSEPELFRSLAILVSLDRLSSYGKVGEKLKHQIPSIEEVKKLSDFISKEAKDLKDYASKMSHRIVKKLTSSLSDFRFNSDTSILEEAIEVYQFLIENPTVLEGVEGNSGHESGIFLVGPPRVGKSHLIDSYLP